MDYDRTFKRSLHIGSTIACRRANQRPNKISFESSCLKALRLVFRLQAIFCSRREKSIKQCFFQYLKKPFTSEIPELCNNKKNTTGKLVSRVFKQTPQLDFCVTLLRENPNTKTRVFPTLLLGPLRHAPSGNRGLSPPDGNNGQHSMHDQST